MSTTGQKSEPSRARARSKGMKKKGSKKQIRKPKAVSSPTDVQTTGTGRPRKTNVEMVDAGDVIKTKEGDQNGGFISTYAAAALGVEKG